MPVSDKLVDVSHPSRDDEFIIAFVTAQPIWDIGCCIVGILRVNLFVADAAFHCYCASFYFTSIAVVMLSAALLPSIIATASLLGSNATPKKLSSVSAVITCLNRWRW